MKTLLSILIIANVSIPNISYAQDHITIECKSSEAHCPIIPKPPAPPKPPLPPQPPAPPTSNNMGIIPPMPPEPPEPPAPPAKLVAPQQTHAACQTKKPGQKMTWIVDKQNEISGTCIQKNGKMEFDIITIRLNS